MGRNTPDVKKLAASIEAGNSLPIGSIVEMASASPIMDDKYLLCGGGVVNKSDWPELQNYVPPITNISSLPQVDITKIFPFTDIRGLEYFNGYWWVINPYFLSKSSDMINWTVVLTTNASSKFSKLKISGDGNKLIAIAGTFFKYSTDGVAWQTCNTMVTDVDTNGTRWVKVTGTTTAFYSDDLTTWTAGSSNSGQNLIGVVYFSTATKWIVSSNNGASGTGFARYSTDGITYSEYTGVGGYSGNAARLRKVGNIVFLSLLGTTTHVWTTDGVTWSGGNVGVVNVSYANGNYHWIKYNGSTQYVYCKGTVFGSATTSYTVNTRSAYPGSTSFWDTYGHIAPHPTSGDVLVFDQYGFWRAKSSAYQMADTSPSVVSEQLADNGMYAIGSCYNYLGYSSIHFINFSAGTFILNAGTDLGTGVYAFDKIFAPSSTHFYIASLLSNNSVYVYKLTVASNVCSYTTGNCILDTTAGSSIGGIKTPSPNKYTAHKKLGNAWFVCTESLVTFSLTVSSGTDTWPNVSLADGVIYLGSVILSGSNAIAIAGIGVTNKSTGVVTMLPCDFSTLCAFTNGNITYDGSSGFYHAGQGGIVDMIAAGPYTGNATELNQCLAGYFIIGSNNTMFSSDGYNWNIVSIKKQNTGGCLAVSYADGKLFINNGAGLTVLAPSDYDPKTQIQLPNIKSSKLGVNCYLKAA